MTRQPLPLPCYGNAFAWAGTDWCGWGFEVVTMMVNGEPAVVRKYDAPTANAMTDAQLAADPVFPLNPPGMNSATISQDLRNELLAKGIPALSPPCGAGSASGISNNVDMTSLNSNGWGRTARDNTAIWLHSDIKNMAFFYTHQLFTEVLQ